MFLRELKIENFRAIKDLKLSFSDADGGIRKWTLILGENGCGKSTILRAAAIVLAGSDALPTLLGPDVNSWIRFESDEAIISAVIQTATGEHREILLKMRRDDSIRSLFESNRETLSKLDDAISHATRNYLTVGYGASRRLNTDPESPFKSRRRISPRASAVWTLFSPDAELEPLESWVIEMDYQGREAQGQELIRKIAKDLMPHVEFDRIDKERKQLIFTTPDGPTPLAQLSDGYQNVAAWCGDLLRSITTIFKDYQDPLSARGLLLVDEIDLHLHPVWQRRLRGFFESTFPNLQFVATTHSPLTVQQSGPGELYVLRRTSARKSPVIEPFEGIPNKMMIHQLLLSPIFNLGSMDSVEVQKKRNKYRSLKSKPNRTKEDQQQLKSLRDSIQELPDLADGLADYKAKQTKILESIHSALIKPNNKKGGTPRKKGGGRTK